MASSGEYTPSRRIAMQAVMWLVLLSGVGLAALVDSQLVRTSRPNLSPDQTSGPLHYRLPSGWDLQSNLTRPLVAVAREHGGQSLIAGGPRTISVYRQHLRFMMPPATYLDRSGLAEEVFGNADVQSDEEILAGQRAVRVVGQVDVPTDQGDSVTVSEMLLCAIFPNREAVTLRLSKVGSFTSGDMDFFNLIASSVRVDATGNGQQ
jgi:hypothetical protein